MDNIFVSVFAGVGICMTVGVGIGYGRALFEHLHCMDDDENL